MGELPRGVMTADPIRIPSADEMRRRRSGSRPVSTAGAPERREGELLRGPPQGERRGTIGSPCSRWSLPMAGGAGTVAMQPFRCLPPQIRSPRPAGRPFRARVTTRRSPPGAGRPRNGAKTGWRRFHSPNRLTFGHPPMSILASKRGMGRPRASGRALEPATTPRRASPFVSFATEPSRSSPPRIEPMGSSRGDPGASSLKRLTLSDARRCHDSRRVPCAASGWPSLPVEPHLG